MLPNKQLVLSSSSPARRALLARLQLPFTRLSPDVDETPLMNENPQDMVERLAVLKAKKAADTYPDSIIIGCDQVGILEGHVLTKPLTFENAIKQLQLVSGKKVRFLTGICLLDAKHNHTQVATEIYDVYFRILDLEIIKAYLQKEHPLHCAGSFQIEGLGITLIEKLEGGDYTALIGLPLIRLTSMLQNIPLHPLHIRNQALL